MPDTSQSRILLLGTSVAGVMTGVTVVGASQPVDASQQNQLTAFLTSIGTTSGGTILLEEADWDPSKDLPYAGTWSTITTFTASSFTGGAQSVFHTTAPAVFAFVRFRISVAITGGGSITAALRMR